MTKNEFIHVLRNPSLMSKEQTFDLEDLVDDFPFFQAARVLYLKGLKNQNSFRYNQTLKTTAAYTTDRSVLFNFITSEEFKNSYQHKNEKQIINQLENVDEKVLENIYKIEEDKMNISEQVSENIPEDNFSNTLKTEETISISEIENVEENLPDNLAQESSIKQTEIDEIADAFLRKIEAENSFTEPISESIPESIPESKSELFAESVSEKISNEISEFNSDSVDKLIDSLNEEIEISAFELEKAIKIENEEDLKNNSKEEDEIVFELLPDEVFEETIQKDEIFEKVKITIDEDYSPPVQFYKNDTLSFSNWLKIATFKPIDRNTDSEKKVSLEEKLELIEDFIIKNPKIEPVKDKINIEVAEKHIPDNEEIMTETLARVYVLQHKYSDAINAYQILSLKFPEKSSFFANQIKQIEVLRKNNFN